LEARPQVGAAGARLLRVDGSVQFSAFRFPSVVGDLAAAMRVAPPLITFWAITYPKCAMARAVDWVSGACMMVRREAFEAVGLLDEEFFLYYEEPDLCRRLERAGWSCWYVPSCAVVHLLAQSVETQDKGRHGRSRHWEDSRRRYFLKHHGPLVLAAADVARMSGAFLWKLRWACMGRPEPGPHAATHERPCDNVVRRSR